MGRTCGVWEKINCTQDLGDLDELSIERRIILN